MFTVGVGAHAPTTRTEICNRPSRLGVRLDAVANATDADRISSRESKVEVRVIAIDEDATIARHTEIAGAPATA